MPFAVQGYHCSSLIRERIPLGPRVVLCLGPYVPMYFLRGIPEYPCGTQDSILQGVEAPVLVRRKREICLSRDSQ
jgi:hypothetical protein